MPGARASQKLADTAHTLEFTLKNDFQTTIAQQQKEIEALTARLKEQAAQIQKVSAQIALGTTAPRVASSE